MYLANTLSRAYLLTTAHPSGAEFEHQHSIWRKPSFVSGHNKQTKKEMEDLTSNKHTSPKTTAKRLVTCPPLQKVISCEWNPFNLELRWHCHVMARRESGNACGETYRNNHYHLRKTKESPDAPTILDITPVRSPGDISSSPTKITREVSHTETPLMPQANFLQLHPRAQ